MDNRLDEIVTVKRGGAEYYKLKNGQLIAVPPRGGKLTREEIRTAVRKVAAQRRAASVG
ncbi:MAG: hypothetical protein WBF53_14500 [Litorimonas sp.]